MFNLVKDTYVILEYNGKNKLALVSNVNASTVTAFLNDEMERDEAVTPIKVLHENIVADLGSSPKVGAAYGVKVEPFYAMDTHDLWGTIKYYRLMKGKEKKWMFKALDRTADKLEETGLTNFLPVELKIHTHQGKHLGYYKHVKKEGHLSTMGICVPTFEIEPDDIDFVIFHEAAHGIWFKNVKSELRAKWVKTFENRIKCKKIKQRELDSILDALSRYEGTVKDFIKHEASDEEQIIIKSCLQHMSKIYKLSITDIDNLLRDDTLDDYWPTQQEISRELPDLSEYSLKSTDEFFAESFAFYMTGTKIPKDIRALLRETIDTIRN